MDHAVSAWHAAVVNGDPGDDAALSRVVDLHQRIRAITTGVILLSRAGTLGMVVLSMAEVVLLDLRLEDGTEPAANVSALRRTGVRVTIPTVRSYPTRIRAMRAAVDEPVDDVRRLAHEYDPRGRPVGSPRNGDIVRAAGSLFARPRRSR
ncbi:hypothetical protein C8E87_8506 [Paractinoplanes brasiliensis]|uniref:Uncharacterized protein n=1 Tax=Paractinoplanes brasiliensis TaxID=52695 RepID=A0A4R6JEL4_9ACTN|nr:hypothetical protein C8E87_8506 [Actinoplanes brasiliensis]